LKEEGKLEGVGVYGKAKVMAEEFMFAIL